MSSLLDPSSWHTAEAQHMNLNECANLSLFRPISLFHVPHGAHSSVGKTDAPLGGCSRGGPGCDGGRRGHCGVVMGGFLEEAFQEGKATAGGGCSPCKDSEGWGGASVVDLSTEPVSCMWRPLPPRTGSCVYGGGRGEGEIQKALQ